ncbi:hypothetical protein KIN20_002477 [Parelaphostrongylus tenuis]|uniref:Uncharacterized protein n=1 Tax=Parelaphostrongylus tenuis TaxID=148309 RepID=A0AAD5QDK2_PARTN|nr:hypothetical protein KIN20_002477 [Parelaphostrongylus tenuis]
MCSIVWREAESRGRVDQLFAVPPPSFTCSITYDGQESWDEESLHSCTEFDEEYYGRHTRSSRPGSSALGAYLSPAAYSSDEDFDGTHFHEEVDVGCTLRLVDKAAMRTDTDEGSEYYDEEEYSDEECWDEKEEHQEDEASGEDEECEEEEKEESDIVDEMQSIEESPDEKSTESTRPLMIAQPAEVEDDINFEEMNDEFEVEMTIELAVPQVVKKPLELPKLHREVTYTKDLTLPVEEGQTETLTVEQEETAKAIKKRIVKDGTSEKVATLRIPQRVVPVEETAAVDESTALPDEEVHQLNPQHHEDDKSRHDVTLVPTYVQPQAETIKEESASRFSNQKVATDFARKAVIQPPKLHTAAVHKIETKTTLEQATSSLETQTQENSAAKVNATTKELPTKNDDALKIVEDKSAVRKSALNMSLEDAKHKAAVDEEAAKQKARRFGTVSSLLNRFKEELKEEPITYKRSCYLDQQEPERPKKHYNIVKPAINDDFDKQMEEIREQMKSGSSQFQNSVKDLSKGITLTAEDIKKRTEEEKKKIIMDSVSGVFSKADEENARWKERRDAETEKELAKIEAEKDRKKKVAVPLPKIESEKVVEPKRTVRKITKEKPSPAQQTKTDDNSIVSSRPAAPARMPTEASSKSTAAVAANTTTEPKAGQKVAAPITKPITVEKPKIPEIENVVNEDNYDLFEAATNVATRGRKSLAELRNQREHNITTKVGTEKEREIAMPSALKTVPKSDGAAATKIRNTLGNSTNVRKTDSPSSKPDREKSPKRYATRRKTQEIVNESAEPKVKRRKQTYRKSKFIRDPHDIDVLLGWDKENTFEKMDQMFSRAAQDRINGFPLKKRKRVSGSKIWISDLTDIDKIYKVSEIRDIIASANA